MQTITAGHLSNNGGLRGHSVGDFYPYVVMGVGTLDNLKWWVVHPSGAKVYGWNTIAMAVSHAQLLYRIKYT
jgi:hypothetical protein